MGENMIHVYMLIIIGSTCFVAGFVLILKSLPPGSIIISLTELKKISDTTAKKDAVMSKTSEDIKSIRSETKKLKEGLSEEHATTNKNTKETTIVLDAKESEENIGEEKYTTGNSESTLPGTTEIT